MPLSDVKLRSLKGAEKALKISDGGGLHVLVTPSGSRLWRLAYRFQGKQKLLALGKYPDTSLTDARKARDAARELLAAGKDPSVVRKHEKRERRIAVGNTFEAIGTEWFEAQKLRWVPSYAERLQSRLKADLFATLGARPIAEILPIEVLDVVRSIERRDAPEMARRVLQMASAIFRYGVATARCVRDPTADLRGALKAKEPAKSRSALRADELPGFLERLANYDGDQSTQLALRLVLLTFVRTTELRFAEWREFEELDSVDALWRIPAERMKMRRAHLVPLGGDPIALFSEVVDRLPANVRI